MIKVVLRFSEDLYYPDQTMTEVEYEFSEGQIKQMTPEEIAIHMAYSSLVADGYLPNVDSHQDPEVSFIKED